MNLSDYLQIVLSTANPEPDKFRRLMNVSLGLAGEVGELLEKVKKEQFHGYEFAHNEMISELGDALYYLILLTYELGYTPDEVAEYNIEKLKKRYPDGFKKGGGIRE